MNQLEAAANILTALIHTTPEMDDVDRIVDMASYMARRLENNLHVPIELLEAIVWPELATTPEQSDDLRNI